MSQQGLNEHEDEQGDVDDRHAPRHAGGKRQTDTQQDRDPDEITHDKVRAEIVEAVEPEDGVAGEVELQDDRDRDRSKPSRVDPAHIATHVALLVARVLCAPPRSGGVDAHVRRLERQPDLAAFPQLQLRKRRRQWKQAKPFW